MTSEAADGSVRLVVEGSVAEVILNRPPVNAVSIAMYENLIRTFAELSGRADVHAVVLHSSNERGFSAGADIREQLDGPSRIETADEYRQRLARTCYEAILNCALPTIAVVNGYTLGAGCVIAACCDIRFGAKDARIGLPEIDAGRCGGGRHLMRLIPQGATRLMYFTGEPMDAEEALRLGYLQKVYASDEVLPAARALAAKIATKSPLGLRLAKRALNEAEPLEVSAGYRREQHYTLRLATHPDAAEAAAATLEGRAPEWVWGTASDSSDAQYP